MYTEFGSTKEIFVNQDEGMFVALPITFDATTLTLETALRNGRTIVTAGSLVLEGDKIKGITAEEYDITHGPVVGRVVLEGYAWSANLTANAVAAAPKLPQIVLLPLDISNGTGE